MKKGFVLMALVLTTLLMAVPASAGTITIMCSGANMPTPCATDR